MRCERAQVELDAYFDGELSATESQAFESHLKDCPSCKSTLAANSQLRSAFESGLPYHRAPLDLVSRIETSIGEGQSDEQPATRIRFPAWQKWSASIAAVAALVAIGLFAFTLRGGADDLLAQEIVSDHIRSMMANHLMDVPSLDRHTVKPWFDGKLDFAPPVKDTAAQGFPLAGGRLDYIAGRPVAALIYKRQQHIINLFVWTSGKAADDSQRILTRQGYNLVHWTQSGMTFWAVSDVELPQLQQFAAAQQSS